MGGIFSMAFVDADKIKKMKDENERFKTTNHHILYDEYGKRLVVGDTVYDRMGRRLVIHRLASDHVIVYDGTRYESMDSVDLSLSKPRDLHAIVEEMRGYGEENANPDILNWANDIERFDNSLGGDQRYGR